jgi:small multidrug resistance pump
MATAYLYLAAAIIFEVLGTIAMKYSEGFTKVVPIILTLICHGICFVALAVALKSLPIGMVYAVWAGVGTALMVFLGMVFFNEPWAFQKVFATFLIIMGVVILNVAPKIDQKQHEQTIANSEGKSHEERPLEALKQKVNVPVITQERNSG